MSNYIDEKKLQDLLKNGKGIPFISPELIKVLGIDEMYRKQGALEELKRQEKELVENIIPMEKARIKECNKKGLNDISQFHKENLFYEDVFLNGIRLRIKDLSREGVEK